MTNEKLIVYLKLPEETGLRRETCGALSEPGRASRKAGLPGGGGGGREAVPDLKPCLGTLGGIESQTLVRDIFMQ